MLAEGTADDLIIPPAPPDDVEKHSLRYLGAFKSADKTMAAGTLEVPALSRAVTEAEATDTVASTALLEAAEASYNAAEKVGDVEEKQALLTAAIMRLQEEQKQLELRHRTAMKHTAALASDMGTARSAHASALERQAIAAVRAAAAGQALADADRDLYATDDLAHMNEIIDNGLTVIAA